MPGDSLLGVRAFVRALVARIAKDLCLLSVQSERGTPACGFFDCSSSDQGWFVSWCEEGATAGLGLPDNQEGFAAFP
jgi:hypothetical protein